MYKDIHHNCYIVRMVNNLNVNKRMRYYVELSISVPFEKTSSLRHIQLKKEKDKKASCPTKYLLLSGYLSDFTYVRICMYIYVCVDMYMYVYVHITIYI